MRMVDLIHQKRQGNPLSAEEITFIIKGYTHGELPDYQMAAFLMAVYYQGMASQEIADLTMAMVNTGDRIDLSPIHGIKVDKHSTGGVGDKLSLIIAPLVASIGIPVAKMSGRGLGHTGGTIDKLESIPGFKVELTNEIFIRHVNEYKMAIVGQTGNLAPADKKIYALRDVTDTVDSIPLIASSIMSKKIASGADCIVLDVKAGSGAFMKTIEDARKLAQTMVDIGNRLNRKTIAVITDMNQPLGHEVGNANEVREAIEVLRGEGAEDLRVISLTVAAHMGVLGGIYADVNTAYNALAKLLANGHALETFKQFVAAQGGDVAVIDHPERLPQAKYHLEVQADEVGYIETMNAEAVGVAAMISGAGRSKKDDVIDPAAGITIKKKIGDYVQAGDTVFIIHSHLMDNEKAREILKKCFTLSDFVPSSAPYIHDTILF
ncbi:MAG: deoA [Bacilli bacterium]|nr:deoA [Bacilli bacterium]